MESLVTRVASSWDRTVRRRARGFAEGTGSGGCVCVVGGAQPFLPYLHTYISVCGPHVGSGLSSNWLLRAGTACVRLTRRWPCLRQLDGDDHVDPRHRLLYRLSEQPFLQLFAFALLVWSPQVHTQSPSVKVSHLL
jgi:hypothetical protein